MKILIMSLVILLVSFQVEAIGKKKSKVDPRDAQIDSLTKVSKNLAVQLDSVSNELVKYVGVYAAIKEQVIHYNFDPTRTSYLIDSLKATRDSTAALLSSAPKSTTASDSISFLLMENKRLKSQNDSIRVAWEMEKSSLTAGEIEKASAINGLKQLKELAGAKIITEAEFATLKKKYLEKL
jgi:hypothetical protein